MPHCCAFGCKNVNNIMHSFPNPGKFPERFKAWVNLVGDKLKSLSDHDIYKKRRICDIHFIREHRNRFKRLNALAMPTLYLPGESHDMEVFTATAQQSETSLSLTDLPSTPTPGESHDMEVFTATAQQSETSLSLTDLPSTPTPGESHDIEVVITTTAQQSETSLSLTDLPSTTTPGECYSVTARTHLFEPINYQSTETSLLTTSTLDNSSYTATNSIVKEHNYSENSKPRQKVSLEDARVDFKNIKIKSLQKKVKYLQNEICRLRKKGKLYRARLEKAEKISKEVAVQQMTKNMSTPAQMFVHMQLQSKKKNKGRRFSIEEKVMALSLFKTSPECYRLLCEYIALPSEKVIKRLLSEIQ